MDVRFKREEWVRDGLEKYVPIRLWFNEDGDLCKYLESPNEVDHSKWYLWWISSFSEWYVGIHQSGLVFRGTLESRARISALAYNGQRLLSSPERAESPWLVHVIRQSHHLLSCLSGGHSSFAQQGQITFSSLSPCEDIVRLSQPWRSLYRDFIPSPTDWTMKTVWESMTVFAETE